MGSLIYIVWFILTIVALVDIIPSRMSTGKKVIWSLVVIFIGYIGTILWFLIGKKNM